jgi:hypothetical protein
MWILMNLIHIGEFYEALLSSLNFHLDWTLLTTTIHKDFHVFLPVSLA